jgi:MFS transporter, DHA1 family, inner membrane transport protein
MPATDRVPVGPSALSGLSRQLLTSLHWRHVFGQPLLKETEMPIALYALALAAFAIGTTEFVVVGLLPTTAVDLAVSVPTAGLLVTGYALGVALGGPLIATVTRRLAHKKTLIGLALFFALGHLIMAVAPNFAILIVVRLLTASAHGAFFGLGSVVAATIVRPDQRGRAISIMMTGVTTANVIGVPGGTFIGQHTSWRIVFVIVAAIATAAALAVTVTVPDDAGARVAGAESGAPVNWRPVCLALITTVIGYGAIFIPFTFVSPYLTRITGLPLGTVTLLLLVFGMASAMGTMTGGPAGDRWPTRALPVVLLGLTAVLLGVWQGAHTAWLVTALMVGWGLTGFALVPLMQSRVVGLAGGGAFASTLNIAAFNVGTAGGAALGGVLVAGGRLGTLPVIAAVLTAGAAGLAVLNNRDVRHREAILVPTTDLVAVANAA